MFVYVHVCKGRYWAEQILDSVGKWVIKIRVYGRISSDSICLCLFPVPFVTWKKLIIECDTPFVIAPDLKSNILVQLYFYRDFNDKAMCSVETSQTGLLSVSCNVIPKHCISV